MTARPSHLGWAVRWEKARTGLQAGFPTYEVFTAPDGAEYRRTKDPSLADVTLETACGPLYLVRRDRAAANLQKGTDNAE